MHQVSCIAGGEMGTATRHPSQERGEGVLLASWEQLDEAGHVGAYGIPYDPMQLTCATRVWPKGTRLKVTEIHNGLSVIVTVTDRNPAGRYALDLSWAAFGRIAGHSLGAAEVKVEVVK